MTGKQLMWEINLIETMLQKMAARLGLDPAIDKDRIEIFTHIGYTVEHYARTEEFMTQFAVSAQKETVPCASSTGSGPSPS